MRTLLSVTLLLLVCLSSVSVAQFGIPQAGNNVGLDSELLPKLLSFDLDKDGYFRLKRSHWDAEEEPEEEAAENETRLQRMQRQMMRRNRQTPFQRLFSEVASDVGTSSRGGGSGSGRRYQRFDGQSVAAEFETQMEESSIRFSFQERVKAVRFIQVFDSDETTRFLLFSTNGFIRILRSASGVQVAAAIDGEAYSFVGNSFVELVKKNGAFFENTLRPALKGIAVVPIDRAVTAEPPKKVPELSLKDAEPAKGPLNERKVVEALRPIVQFRLVDRRLRLDRSPGPEKLLEEETKRVTEEVDNVITAAIERLRKRGGTELQVGQLKQEMARAADRPDRRMGVWNARPQSPVIKIFNDVRALIGSSGSSFSGGGNGGFSLGFDGETSGRVAGSATQQRVFLADRYTRLDIRETEDFTCIVFASGESLLLLVQKDEPRTCALAVLRNGTVKTFSGMTLLSVIEQAKVTFQRDVVQQLGKFGVGGLDPFEDTLVRGVESRLAKDLPLLMDEADAKTAADIATFPLLNDPEYLLAIQDRIDPAKLKTLRSRIVALRKAEKKDQPPSDESPSDGK